MTDAPSTSGAGPVKRAGGAKAKGTAGDGGVDGKKRFEVKKVRMSGGEIYYDSEADEILLVERSRSVGMGHCCRQLRHLQKPHHGSMYVALTGSSALSTDTQ